MENIQRLIFIQMIKKSVFYLSAFFFIVGSFQSCISLDVEKEAISDVYVVTKILNGDTLYALDSYVNSNDIMTAVSLKYPESSREISLTKYTSSYFERAGIDSLFTKQKPIAGNYIFTINYEDGTNVTTVNNLTNKIAKFVTVKKAEPADGGGAMNIEWSKDTNADKYIIQILKKNVIVFSSTQLDSVYSGATISTYTTGWANNANPKDGDSLEVVVKGVLLDYSGKYTQFQSVSESASKPIVWVENM
jgi:hypothetical protein